MKFRASAVIPALVVFTSFLIFVQSRTVPAGRLWDGYQVLYVYSQDLSGADIYSVLEKNGCRGVIAQNVQRIPVVSPVAPVQAQSAGSYIFRRNGFFTDRDNRALVFYIPEGQGAQMEKAMREIRAFQGTKAGTDGKNALPWLAPSIALFFFAVLLFFSPKRVLFCIGSFSPLVFAVCRPYFTVAAASSLFLFAFFLFHKMWMHNGFLKEAFNSPFILLLSLSPVLVLFFASPLDSFFYVLGGISCAASVYLYGMYREKKDSGLSFRPVPIRSARMVFAFGQIGMHLVWLLVFCLAVVFIAYCFLGAASDFSDDSSEPFLPAPVQRGASLPGMKDCLEWSWNTVTFPYRKIHDFTPDVPDEGEAVSITDYIEENGAIRSVENTVYVFNSQFREFIYDAVEHLEYPALEKMLLKQGKYAVYGYVKGNSAASSERFGTALLVVFIALPSALGIYYYIVGRKRYGLGI